MNEDARPAVGFAVVDQLAARTVDEHDRDVRDRCRREQPGVLVVVENHRDCTCVPSVRLLHDEVTSAAPDQGDLSAETAGRKRRAGIGK